MRQLAPLTPTLSSKFNYHSGASAKVVPRLLWRKYYITNIADPSTNYTRHRLSTIMNADRIVVVEHGEVVEQGNHSKLIVANGRYADLWSKQVFIRPRDNPDPVDFIDDRTAVVDDLASKQTATELGRAERTDSDSEMLTADEDQSEQNSSSLGQHRKEV
ncbi:hypothetical protein J3459_014653 [Metarhizium acridum]|nr:hypothetical protein J3459_014653 [Metarhizium acridum]